MRRTDRYDLCPIANGLVIPKGDNHFIELNGTDDGRLFLVIQTRSRALGVKVASKLVKSRVLESGCLSIF